MLNVCSISLRGIAPRVQWPFVVRISRNAVVAMKYLEIKCIWRDASIFEAQRYRCQQTQRGRFTVLYAVDCLRRLTRMSSTFECAGSLCVFDKSGVYKNLGERIRNDWCLLIAKTPTLRRIRYASIHSRPCVARHNDDAKANPIDASVRFRGEGKGLSGFAEGHQVTYSRRAIYGACAPFTLHGFAISRSRKARSAVG